MADGDLAMPGQLGGRPQDREAPDYLCLSGLTKSYAELVVVRDVSLRIAKGEILTILGPSGCGKTTTLKIVAGFLQPDKGSVTIEGKEVGALSS
ncbi:MAG TPA: ATP-binding cassette domain-containing protein, partial [Rhodopila sp.]